MPNEPQARAIQPSPDAPNEADYQALSAALSESGRGRAFLAEHARRNRDAESVALQAAIERLEAHLQAEGSAVQRLRDELRMLLIAIRIVRPEIGAAGTEAAKAAKLTDLLDLLERRIDAMCGTSSAQLAPPGKAPDAMPDKPAEAPRAPLAATRPPERLEMPPRPPARSKPRKATLPAGAAPAQADPLAAMMALSEDERLALFT